MGKGNVKVGKREPEKGGREFFFSGTRRVLWEWAGHHDRRKGGNEGEGKE